MENINGSKSKESFTVNIQTFSSDTKKLRATDATMHWQTLNYTMRVYTCTLVF